MNVTKRRGLSASFSDGDLIRSTGSDSNVINAAAGRRRDLTIGGTVNKLLLTPTEAADLLGVSRTTVYELLNAEQIESVRIGRARRIPRAALVAYVDRLRGLSDREAAA